MVSTYKSVSISIHCHTSIVVKGMSSRTSCLGSNSDSAPGNITLGKQLTSPMPNFLHLQNRDNNTKICLIGLLWGINVKYM